MEFYFDEIPCFTKSECSEDFLDWVTEAEQRFEMLEIPKEKIVKVVAERLNGSAYETWKHILKIRQQQGKSTVKTWRVMKRLIVKQLFPYEYDLYLSREYPNRTLVTLVIEAKKEEESPIVVIENPTVVKIYDEEQDFKLTMKPDVEGEKKEHKGYSCKEFDYQLKNSNVVCGTNYMMMPSKYEEDWIPQVKDSICLSYLVITEDQVQFKTNSRSSSFQVEESDVGRVMVRFKKNKNRKRKQLKISKKTRNKETNHI